MLKPAVFPAIYERVSPRRTEDEIWRGINERFDKPAQEPLRTNSTPLAPPPPDRQQKASADIAKRPEPLPDSPRIRRGRPGKRLRCPPDKHKWVKIGKAKAAGRMRQRCSKCKGERTVKTPPE